MEILIKASQFILSLSLLIVLHELGHFIPAKLFKTRVEKFYLFFDYKFSLFKKKKSMERISSLRRQDCPKAAHSQGRPNCLVTDVAAALPPGCARLTAGSMHKLRGNKSPHLEVNANRFYSSCCCCRRCCNGDDGGGDCCKMF